MIEIEEARRVLRVESKCLLDVAERLDDNFKKCVDLILACKGKVILTGIGKSGLVARKIASTLSSTGTPSLFLHPAESAHGDLGVISNNDLVVAISSSGESDELISIINYITRRNIACISMTGNPKSSLGKVGVFLDISAKEEACPLGLAPMSTTTVTLALGDALASAVIRMRGFTRKDFAEFHPHGTLGRRLYLRVKDLMHSGDQLPVVKKSSMMKEVISLMTSADVRGVAGVVDENDQLCGVITDGDIRRRLEKNQNPLTEKAETMMSLAPKTIDHMEMAEKALFVMEQFQIQNLFVLDKGAQNPFKPVGLIHLQDLIRAKLR